MKLFAVIAVSEVAIGEAWIEEIFTSKKDAEKFIEAEKTRLGTTRTCSYVIDEFVTYAIEDSTSK